MEGKLEIKENSINKTVRQTKRSRLPLDYTQTLTFILGWEEHTIVRLMYELPLKSILCPQNPALFQKRRFRER